MKNWLRILHGLTKQHAFPVVWDTSLPSLYQRLQPTFARPQPLAWDDDVLAPEPLGDSDEMFWAPGAREGTMIYHSGTEREDAGTARILFALKQVLEKADVESMQALYDLIIDDSPLFYIDDLLKVLPSTRDLRANKLRQLVCFLCTQSPDSNVVKFAMALMAFFPQQRNIEVLQVLACHDEFTLYAVVALRMMVKPRHYARVWFSMAQRVNGWGRIHLMERIPDAPDATIRGWLLREGCSNSVMNEYTALNCAVHGRLSEAMETEHDDALLLGAAEILSALINEGPVAGMSVYEDGAQACLRYLHSVLTHQPAHPLHYITARLIREWAGSEEQCDRAHAPQLEKLCDEVRALPLWEAVAEVHLA